DWPRTAVVHLVRRTDTFCLGARRPNADRLCAISAVRLADAVVQPATRHSNHRGRTATRPELPADSAGPQVDRRAEPGLLDPELMDEIVQRCCLAGEQTLA